jgi:hypothetical protein
MYRAIIKKSTVYLNNGLVSINQDKRYNMGNIRHRIIMQKEVIRWLRKIVVGMIGVQRSELEYF